MGDQGFPTPLPEFEGGTTDQHLADTVNRYSRMAPIYDQALDEVEKKYGGFDLRRELVSQAQGHVLEIGVGTARNLPYYDNTKVNSITFVDSTYPMLNAALVKMHDLYKIHHKDTAIATVDQKFDFEVKPTRSFQELNDESIQFFKKQFETIAARGSDGNSHSNDESGCDHCHHTASSSPSHQPTIHSTYRPQLLYPIDSNLDPTMIKSRLPAMLRSFPIPIQHMFDRNIDQVLVDNMDNSVSIEDEQSIGAKLLRLPELPAAVAVTGATSTNPHATTTQTPLDSKSPSQATPSTGVGAANRFDIEKYDRAQREVARIVSQGQSWKSATRVQNVIPAAFVHLDCHDLSFFPSNSYDTIVDTFGLCSFHHPVDVLREIRRICKPGGKILLLEHGLGTNPVINQVIRSTNQSHMKQWGCDRSKDIVQLLSEAGYDVKKVSRHHGGSTIVWGGTPSKTLLEVQDAAKMPTSSVSHPRSD